MVVLAGVVFQNQVSNSTLYLLFHIVYTSKQKRIKLLKLFMRLIVLGVYTSYDYGAAISEPGLMTTKAYENKLQGNLLYKHSITTFIVFHFLRLKILFVLLQQHSFTR